MDRPQAIQFVAVTLAPLDGEARRVRAWEVGDQLDQACQALRALLLTSTPCVGVVQIQLRAARALCESWTWIEWWDEIEELPMEASRPEPGFCGRLPLDLVLCLPMLRWFTLPVTSWPNITIVSLKMIALGSANCYTQPTMRPVLRVTLSVGRRCIAWAWSSASL